MCRLCESIGAVGRLPKELLDHELKLTGLTNYDEPLFTDNTGRTWGIVRDPIYEDMWFIPKEADVNSAS